MAYYSKYTGKELEERLDRINDIPALIDKLFLNKEYLTELEVKCLIKEMIPLFYKDIPIDNKTIYWDNGVLKSVCTGEENNEEEEEDYQCLWELREHNGQQYIYSKLPVVTQYGITIYGNNGDIDLPSLYAGLPIDGQTIYWDNGVLKSLGGGGEGLDEEALRNYLLINGYVTRDELPSLNGYATESWVLNLGYIGPEGLKNYVDISSNQDINGKKNFKSGISINGLDIYQSQDDVIYLDANLVVRGGITMYGDSVSGGSAGATTLGQLQNVGTWADSVADVDRIMYQAAGSSNWVAKSLSSIGGVSGDYLPLSGGTVNTSEIYGIKINSTNTNSGIEFDVNNVPTGVVITGDKYGIAILNMSGTYNALGVKDDGTPYFLNHYDNSYSTLWHSGNFTPSNYLPLSGGKLKSSDSPLIIERTDHNSPYVAFMYNNSFVGGIGVLEGDTAFYNPLASSWQKIWNSGNDGSGSGLDADLLDGLDSSFFGKLIPNHQSDLNVTDITFRGGKIFNASNAATADSAYRSLLEFGYANYGSQINGGSQNDLYYRWCEAGTWGKWRTFAFTDSNVASATKLQTARTIWGQSFDGTGNVSGVLWYVTAMVTTDSYGIYQGNAFTGALGETDLAYYASKHHFNGSIGIGTTSPSCTLDVNGDTHTGKIYLRDTYINLNRNGSDGKIYDSSRTALEIEATVNLAILRTYNVDTQASIILHKNGNIGIGTTSPYFKLDAKGQSRFLSAQNSSITNETCSIIVGTNLAGITGYNSGIGFRALTDYNTSYINHNHAWIGLSSYESTTEAELYDLVFATNGSTKTNNYPTERMRILYNGNVGIGTTNPNYKLHVNNGDIATNQYIRVIAWTGYGSGSCNMWYDGTNTRLDMSSGLKVASNILAGGGITMYSDQRKKTILGNVELSLKQIANAPLIEHYYNSDDKKTTHVGSIAQYWASMNDWFCKLDNEGYYTMEIQNCALASAISIARELDRYESKTDKTIKQLKKRICQLEEEVERLRAS